MATQSSILAGKSHGQEPGRLQSMESQRVGRDLATKSPPKQDACIISLVMSVLTSNTNLDSILKSRDIILQTKVRLVKGMVSPVVMYGCESWTVKKAEHRRIGAFELWCWRRLLRSVLEISPGCSLEGLMMKLKLQYFGHLM